MLAGHDLREGLLFALPELPAAMARYHQLRVVRREQMAVRYHPTCVIVRMPSFQSKGLHEN